MFVTRDQSNKINGAYNMAQFKGQEQMADDGAELVAFQASQAVPDGSFLLRRIAALETNVNAVMALPAISSALTVAPAPVALGS